MLQLLCTLLLVPPLLLQLNAPGCSNWLEMIYYNLCMSPLRSRVVIMRLNCCLKLQTLWYQWEHLYLNSNMAHLSIPASCFINALVLSQFYLHGVPQGTVLGPLMFLLYTNDITKGVSSHLRLFADDCLLYRIINSAEDSIRLQEDLNRLSAWANIWQLKFNVSKCTVIRSTRSLSPLTHIYTLNTYTLDVSDQHSYLGVIVHKSLSWSHTLLPSIQFT